MSPSFVSNFSSFPLLEGDRDPSHLHPLPPTINSSLPYSFFFNNPRDQGAITSDLGHRHHQEPQPQELDERFLVGAPRDQLSFPCYYNNHNHHHHENYDNKTVQRLCVQHVGEDGQHGTAKRMIPKVRLLRKMMDAHQTVETKPRKNMQVIQGQNHRNQESSSNKSNKNNDNGSPSGAIRVCSDCNTTKTPLWRSGPRGPKSLCNACGIRQRKTRRAMEAAAVSGGLISTDTPTKAQKEKISDVYLTLPLKKRCKITTSGTSTTPKKLCFDDIMINLSNNSTFHRIFPQDERDAAILLMALSCGIIRS